MFLKILLNFMVFFGIAVIVSGSDTADGTSFWNNGRVGEESFFRTSSSADKKEAPGSGEKESAREKLRKRYVGEVIDLVGGASKKKNPVNPVKRLEENREQSQEREGK